MGNSVDEEKKGGGGGGEMSEYYRMKRKRGGGRGGEGNREDSLEGACRGNLMAEDQENLIK